jgi:hypothetical protein
MLAACACTKPYVCNCYNLQGNTEPTKYRYKKETRSQAAEKCAAAEAAAPPGTVDCRLESK